MRRQVFPAADLQDVVIGDWSTRAVRRNVKAATGPWPEKWQASRRIGFRPTEFAVPVGHGHVLAGCLNFSRCGVQSRANSARGFTGRIGPEVSVQCLEKSIVAGRVLNPMPVQRIANHLPQPSFPDLIRNPPFDGGWRSPHFLNADDDNIRMETPSFAATSAIGST